MQYAFLKLFLIHTKTYIGLFDVFRFRNYCKVKIQLYK